MERQIKKSKSKIIRSILKNGYSSFSLEILEYCDQDIAVSREQYYLDLLKPEYNILTKAGSSLGYKHSAETIAKLKGRKHSPEAIAKMKNRNFTEVDKAKRLEQLKRIHANPEFKAKNLEHLKRLNSSAEFKAKNLEHLKRLHDNPEFKAKNLEHLKRLHADSELKAKRLEQLKVINASKKGCAKPEGSGRPNVSIEVLDTLNNETTIYSSISEAAQAIGVNKGSISKAFKRNGDSLIYIKKKRYQITKLP